MKIGVIGSGNMGRSMGVALAHQGHTVLFGARRAEQAEQGASLAGGTAQSGSNDEAASFGDVLLWTVREVDPTLVLADASVLDGKILIDLNNNETRSDGGVGPQGEALAVKLQRANANTAVVKAFNTLPQEVFAVPKAELQARAVSVFLAGDDDAAKQTVRGLAEDLGFTAIDLGPLAAAGAAEALGDIVRMVLRRGIPLHSAISVQTLLQPDTTRFGGRQSSKLK